MQRDQIIENLKRIRIEIGVCMSASYAIPPNVGQMGSAIRGATKGIDELVHALEMHGLTEPTRGFCLPPPPPRPWDGLPPGSEITIRLPVVTREQEAIERQEAAEQMRRAMRSVLRPTAEVGR